MSPKPSPSVQLADDRAWQIERYVLADPTLDRQNFEAAMADDLELALAVARSVAQMQGLTLACRGSVNTTIRPPAAADCGPWLPRRQVLILATAALAAAWLVSFIAWQTLAPEPNQFFPATAKRGAEQQLAEVAQQWIALDPLMSVAAEDTAPWLSAASDPLSDLTAGKLSGAESDRSELEAHAAANTHEEYDWMLQVSAAFFEESES